MAHSSSITLCSILLISSLYNVASTATEMSDTNPQTFGCMHSKIASTSYRNNVNLLLTDFIFQSGFKGYYNTSTGNGSDIVFGYYLCRGDLQPKSCRNCLSKATKYVQRADCKFQDGTFLSPKCIFRYANYSMYGIWERNIGVISPFGFNESNYKQYNRTLVPTVEAVINKAAFGTDNNESTLGFATKEANVTRNEKIYTLVQCRPDIVGANCSSCLREAFSGIRSTYGGYQGAQITTANCLFRYNNLSFYEHKLEKPNEDHLTPPPLEALKPNKIDGLRPPNFIISYFAMFLFMYLF